METSEWSATTKTYDKLGKVRTTTAKGATVAMGISASRLRADIYRLLDEVLDTQQPLEIERKGRVLVITPKEQGSRLDRLPRRDDFIAGDPEDLVSLDWSGEWRP
jgi:hypothetical protein